MVSEYRHIALMQMYIDTLLIRETEQYQNYHYFERVFAPEERTGS